jgi:sarcosine oxidase, subunit alpha
MPYTPVTFGTLAGSSRGELFDPVRTTPVHHWSAEQGAVFEDVSTWKRARYYPQSGEGMETTVARETRTVRERVGVLDASARLRRQALA